MLSLFFRSRLGTSDSLGILFSKESIHGFSQFVMRAFLGTKMSSGLHRTFCWPFPLPFFSQISKVKESSYQLLRVEEYLGTPGPRGGQWSLGPSRELQRISQSQVEDETGMSAASF